MPQHKSAEKRIKTNDRDRVRNIANRSRLRKAVTTFRSIEDGNEATKGLSAATSEIDSALKKGIIPKGRADRLKSRLARRRNRLVSASN